MDELCEKGSAETLAAELHEAVTKEIVDVHYKLQRYVNSNSTGFFC